MSGDGGTRKSSISVAAQPRVLPLPFGGMALHLGMRRFCPAVLCLPDAHPIGGAGSAASSRHRAGLSLRRLVRIPCRQTADEHKREQNGGDEYQLQRIGHTHSPSPVSRPGWLSLAASEYPSVFAVARLAAWQCSQRCTVP
jgi:hypothetical protein